MPPFSGFCFFRHQTTVALSTSVIKMKVVDLSCALKMRSSISGHSPIFINQLKLNAMRGRPSGVYWVLIMSGDVSIASVFNRVVHLPAAENLPHWVVVFCTSGAAIDSHNF